jgi:hypothetical protein
MTVFRVFLSWIRSWFTKSEKVVDSPVTALPPVVEEPVEAPAETHSISGNCGCAHASVFLIGAAKKLMVSDEKGFYAFENLSDGRYTVLPYKSGETFRPISQTVVIAGADLTGVNFIDPSSVVDSRVSANHPRTVQGTIFYDIVPTDSRVVPASTPTFSITSVAAAVAGNTSYTGTFSPASLPAGSIAIISGFVNAPNNGSFQVVSCTATTLVLANANGIAETHAATAMPNFPVDSRAAGAPVDCRVAPNVPQNSRA